MTTPRHEQHTDASASATATADPRRAPTWLDAFVQAWRDHRRLRREALRERGPKFAQPPVKLAMPGIPVSARTRALLAATCLTAALGGLTVKAWGLQVGQRDQFRSQAARQHLLTVELAAPRGAILDRAGRSLAASADVESVWVNPHAVVDVTATAEKLAALTGGDVRVLEERLASDKHFAWVARHVTPQVAARVRAAGLRGVEIALEPRRWYPVGAGGATLIGRANIDGAGLEGIELSLDRVLAGQRARTPAVRDARGRKVLADGLVPAMAGSDVRLTIDRTIQSISDGALAAAMAQFKAAAGIAVVLDVATGEVLALSNAPTFDPNTAAAHAGARKRAVTDVYEIGSVMKVFTVAAALDLGLTRPDEWFDVERGRYLIAGKTVRDVHHDSVLTTSGIIKRSSNVGAVKLGMRVGRDRLYQAFRNYGFAQKTGIELPGEQGGVMRPGSRWRDIELVTATYGYGLTVSPLQVAASLAAIGNGGVYQAPRVVAEVIDPDGSRRQLERPPARQVMSAKTANALLVMLASVFEGGKQAGTASKLVIPGFACGGKSGTAHKLDPQTRRYAPNRYLSSFAGLAPIDKPRLAIVVIIDEPSGKDYFGGKVAGPVFAAIASDSLRYLGVPGSAPVPPVAADDKAAEESLGEMTPPTESADPDDAAETADAAEADPQVGPVAVPGEVD